MQTLYSPRPVQPNHFQPSLIWCDGTFKLLLQLLVVVSSEHLCGLVVVFTASFICEFVELQNTRVAVVDRGIHLHASENKCIVTRQ
jgi:hypothetical protein